MSSHKNIALLAAGAVSTFALLAPPAEAELLVAGWDSFTSEPESSSAATQTDGVTGATMTGSGTGGNWNDWNNGAQGASGDGTFGSLSNAIAAASTNIGTGSNQNTNLSLNRSVKPGTLTINLVNNSGSDRDLMGFYFDGGYRFTQSARNWELAFSNAISGTAASGTLSQVSNLNNASAGDRDWFVDLTGLADSTWEAGSTATFTMTFTGGDSAASTGGGHETLIDNIGITVVPEPSAFALLALGGLTLARRRR